MRFLLIVFLFSVCGLATAGDLMPAVTVKTAADGSQTYSVTLQILALMTALTFIPAALIMMTSFTRIIIVLAILRHALGLPSSPSNQTIVGMALFLTIFIMSPVFEKINEDAIQPYISDKLTLQDAAMSASQPIKTFMLGQTRNTDLELFVGMSGEKELESREQVPLKILIPAFVTSELKTAFQIGFLLFIPFLIIDLVVASVLMSMGMMMLSPMIISLPFKIMLFVLVDGWNLVMGTIAASFYVQ